jgi:hypothetical protein
MLVSCPVTLPVDLQSNQLTPHCQQSQCKLQIHVKPGAQIEQCDSVLLVRRLLLLLTRQQEIHWPLQRDQNVFQKSRISRISLAFCSNIVREYVARVSARLLERHKQTIKITNLA